MNSISPQFVVLILCYLAMGLAAVVLLVIGIMIAANKTKQTKVLGIGYIITSISSGAVFLYNLLLLVYNTEKVLVFGDAVMIGTIICIMASLLCVCIYLHKNYGRKFVYIPVLLLPVVGMIASAAVALMLNKAGLGGFEYSMLISLVNDVNNVVSIAAAAVIIIVVIYKNREKEKIIPKAWLVKTITVIWSVIEIVIISITYLSVIKSAESLGLKAYSDNTFMALTMVQTLDSLVTLVVPVYVLSKVSKASGKEKAAA